MVKYLTVSIFIFLILFLLYRLWIQYNYLSNLKLLKVSKIQDIYPVIKTGDLVLFSDKEVFGLKRFILGEGWTHIGIVIEINNKKYIFEHKINGTVVHPFSLRVYSYVGDVAVMFLNKKITPEMYKNLLEYISNYKHCKFYENPAFRFLTHCSLKRLGLINGDNKQRCRYVCSEFIGFVLRKIGILNNKHNIDCNYPDDYTLFNFGNDYQYSKPVVIYDNFDLRNTGLFEKDFDLKQI